MSGRKNIFKRKVNTDTSLATSFRTPPISLETMSLVGYNIATSDVSSNASEFYLQHRMYIDVNNYSEWCSLTLDVPVVLSNADIITEIIGSSLPPGQVCLFYDAVGAQVQTLTFPALADATDGDYVVITDKNGVLWAIALDTTGAAAATPTGASWVAIPSSHKIYKDISGATTAASVAALAETGLNSLTGFSSVLTTNDTAADGTMTLTSSAAGFGSAPIPHNADDSDAGTILGELTSGPNGTVTIFESAGQE